MTPQVFLIQPLLRVCKNKVEQQINILQLNWATMQTHDLVTYPEQLSQAIQKDTKEKTTQALNAQIQATLVMSL